MRRKKAKYRRATSETDCLTGAHVSNLLESGVRLLGQIIRVNGRPAKFRAGFATAKEQFPVAHRRLPPPVRARACRSAKRAYTCVRVSGYERHTRVCARANDLFLAGVVQPPDALFGATHGHATILRLLFFSVCPPPSVGVLSLSLSLSLLFSLFSLFSLLSESFPPPPPPPPQSRFKALYVVCFRSKDLPQ